MNWKPWLAAGALLACPPAAAATMEPDWDALAAELQAAAKNPAGQDAAGRPVAAQQRQPIPCTTWVYTAQMDLVRPRKRGTVFEMKPGEAPVVPPSEDKVFAKKGRTVNLSSVIYGEDHILVNVNGGSLPREDKKRERKSPLGATWRITTGPRPPGELSCKDFEKLIKGALVSSQMLLIADEFSNRPYITQIDIPHVRKIGETIPMTAGLPPNPERMEAMLSANESAWPKGTTVKVALVYGKDYILVNLNGGSPKKPKWWQNKTITGTSGASVTTSGPDTVDPQSEDAGVSFKISFPKEQLREGKFLPELTAEQFLEILKPILVPEENKRTKTVEEKIPEKYLKTFESGSMIVETGMNLYTVNVALTQMIQRETGLAVEPYPDYLDGYLEADGRRITIYVFTIMGSEKIWVFCSGDQLKDQRVVKIKRFRGNQEIPYP